MHNHFCECGEKNIVYCNPTEFESESLLLNELLQLNTFPAPHTSLLFPLLYFLFYLSFLFFFLVPMFTMKILSSFFIKSLCSFNERKFLFFSLLLFFFLSIQSQWWENQFSRLAHWKSTVRLCLLPQNEHWKQFHFDIDWKERREIRWYDIKSFLIEKFLMTIIIISIITIIQFDEIKKINLM